MEPPIIAVLAASFFFGQVGFELNRKITSDVFGRAYRNMSSIRPLWDFIAIAAILAGLSIVIFGFMNWTWWKVILLWLGMGFLGGVFGKSLWRRDEGVLVKIERVLHLAIVAGAAFVWAQFFELYH